ncbi:hypothetical protein C7974DRAFT_392496 [Boeremia exigua]|uniref:uncharacterized protein n=1 Tax=Boeremia exigua TaxID=749465 RepID=UPI001E8E93CD|nr:uncharacterized protein C7974DRAFT_392496 [Boeremia exigua]KAH6633304.1 hypothetical protein C7974DRAFT_392496 [Boeremia exigua]
MANPPGAFTRAWYEWKMLRFPWRKKWLVGFDLQGNTFWEFKDALHSLRNRRIAKYHRSTHYSEVNVSPAWMQWLRHTRFEPPSLEEQRANVQRQATLKLLAARADARWAAKPGALDAPEKQQPMPMLESRDPESGIAPPGEGLNSAGTEAGGVEVGGAKGRRAEAGRAEEADVAPIAEAPQTESTQTEPAPFTAKKRMRTHKPPKEDSPWKQPAGNPGDDWQPKPWAPPPRRR